MIRWEVELIASEVSSPKEQLLVSPNCWFLLIAPFAFAGGYHADFFVTANLPSAALWGHSWGSLARQRTSLKFVEINDKLTMPKSFSKKLFTSTFPWSSYGSASAWRVTCFWARTVCTSKTSRASEMWRFSLRTPQMRAPCKTVSSLASQTIAKASLMRFWGDLADAWPAAGHEFRGLKCSNAKNDQLSVSMESMVTPLWSLSESQLRIRSCVSACRFENGWADYWKRQRWTNVLFANVWIIQSGSRFKAQADHIHVIVMF